MVSLSFKPDCVMSKCYVKGKCCSSLFRFFYFCNQKIMASQKLLLIIKICDAVVYSTIGISLICPLKMTNNIYMILS